MLSMSKRSEYGELLSARFRLARIVEARGLPSLDDADTENKSGMRQLNYLRSFGSLASFHLDKLDALERTRSVQAIFQFTEFDRISSIFLLAIIQLYCIRGNDDPKLY